MTDRGWEGDYGERGCDWLAEQLNKFLNERQKKNRIERKQKAALVRSSRKEADSADKRHNIIYGLGVRWTWSYFTDWRCLLKSHVKVRFFSHSKFLQTLMNADNAQAQPTHAPLIPFIYQYFSVAEDGHDCYQADWKTITSKMMRISKKLQVTRKTEKRRDNVFQWSRVACTTTAPIAPIGLASGNRGLAGLDGGTESVSREKGWEVGGGHIWTTDWARGRAGWGGGGVEHRLSLMNHCPNKHTCSRISTTSEDTDLNALPGDVS